MVMGTEVWALSQLARYGSSAHPTIAGGLGAEMPPKKKEEAPSEPVDVDYLADDRQTMETEDTARVMVDYLLSHVATHADTSNLQKFVPM
jgi:hypothetical protein